ncbi:peptide chain release factor N(5)-glutamine methyltransferase [Alteromonas sediminis]|uniref:Release factor glutamine methyltransferase n=1 Tax=Alteromonas sediminis TaxID=2259342 RepID=A0A3N5ZBU7_9ALTE|nr:peptide chain release factor N(5)-glutamine methyltransferase [Alteromonas sediminis]RPJ67178.1 peptide chain release factor N(5)-glutamine methyltransferase [Alteromonas sediminis]
MNIGQARQWARGLLDEPTDADYLLSAVLNKPRSFLFAFDDVVLSQEQELQFKDAVERRVTGEPVAYITGVKEFWSLPLYVSPATLIPRPETELLVETVLEKVNIEKASICDLGTGTGAVALAIGHEKPNWDVVGVDRITQAVMVASQNAANLAITNVDFLQSDWFSSLTGKKFDAIVTNPPYVESDSKYLAEGDVRFEPESALCAGYDGLDDIRIIIECAGTHLNHGGWLMIEHGFDQHQNVAALLRNADFVDIAAIEDLNLYQRVTIARLRAEQKATRGKAYE